MKIFLIIVGVLVVLIALLMSLSATLTLIYDGGWHTSVQVLFIKKDIVLSQILSFILFPEKSAEQAKKKGKEKKENKKDTTEPPPKNAPTEDEKATQAAPDKAESEKAPAKAEEKPKKPNYFQQLWDKDGVIGYLLLISNLVETASSAVTTLFRGFHIYSLYVKMIVGGADAADIAEKYGVKIDFRPFIKVESLSAKEFRQQKVSILDHTAVIFTSRHAIDHFFNLCAELRVTVPETMKYFCTSETIALYIQKYVQYRKRKVFFGATGKFADLLPQIIKHNTEKYFIPMSDVHNDEVKDLLDKNHIQHTEAVMYRTVSNDFTPEEEFNYDMLIFFSPAGIQSLMKNFPNFEQKDIAIGSFGPTTAKAVKDAGLRLDLEAPSSVAPSMPAALDMFIREHNK